MTISKAIARAWTDAEYKSKLLSNPRAALAEAGVDVHTDTTVKVIEDTAHIRHLVLPVAPKNAGELSTEELEKVAGGVTDPSTDISITPNPDYYVGGGGYDP